MIYTERMKYPAGTKTLQVLPAQQPLPLKQPQEAELQHPKASPRIWDPPPCVQRQAPGPFLQHKYPTLLSSLSSHSQLTSSPERLPRHSCEIQPVKQADNDTKKQDTWQGKRHQEKQPDEEITSPENIHYPLLAKLKQFMP